MAQPGSYCIVTGANAGIGKEVTAGLMARGAHVVMACRNMDACREAQQQLQQRELPGTCESARLDLADLASVRSFAAEQAQRSQRLSVLVNNAGVMGAGAAKPGEDQHLKINHLGPFLLTNLLLQSSSLSSGSRIVNVASRAHFASRGVAINRTDRTFLPGPSWWWSQYATSKLCNILFTSELQRRFQHSRGVVSVAVSPGFVRTTIFRGQASASVAWLLNGIAAAVGRTPAEGAAVVVHAAVSPELSAAAPVPLLLHDCKPLRPSRLAEDKQLAADLWEASEAAVGWEQPAEGCRASAAAGAATPSAS